MVKNSLMLLDLNARHVAVAAIIAMLDKGNDIECGCYNSGLNCCDICKISVDSVRPVCVHKGVLVFLDCAMLLNSSFLFDFMI